MWSVFLCVQSTIFLSVLRIANMRTDVDACDCTRGPYGHGKRVCTENWLGEKKSLAYLGLEPASVFSPGFSAGRSTSCAIPRPKHGTYVWAVQLMRIVRVSNSVFYAQLTSAVISGREGSSEPDLKRTMCQHKHKVKTTQSIGFNLSVWNTACYIPPEVDLHPQANERPPFGLRWRKSQKSQRVVTLEQRLG